MFRISLLVHAFTYTNYVGVEENVYKTVMMNEGRGDVVLEMSKWFWLAQTTHEKHLSGNHKTINSPPMVEVRSLERGLVFCLLLIDFPDERVFQRHLVEVMSKMDSN